MAKDATGVVLKDAKARLLQAASELFLHHGFERTTVRDICGRAGVNVAAVNYHFGDKLGLYRAVLFATVEGLPEWVGQAGVPPEARLRAFIRDRLDAWFVENRLLCGDALMLRELIEPTPVLEEVVRARLAPAAQRLLHLVQDLMGAPRTPLEAAPEREMLCALSVIGQCLHHFFCRNVTPMLFPGMGYDPESVERLAAHIAEFSLAGVRAVARSVELQGAASAAGVFVDVADDGDA